MSNKRRFSFGLRELFVGISVIAFALCFEQRATSFGAVGAAIAIGGLSVLYVRDELDAIIAVAIGTLVFSLWCAVACNLERCLSADSLPSFYRAPLWLSIILTAVTTIPAGAICTFSSFAFFKFWHFALTLPLQYEIDHKEETTETDTHQ